MATKPTSGIFWDSGNALAAGCVRYWLADAANTTTVFDYSPSGRNLTWVGTPGSDAAPGGGAGTEYALNGTQYATGADNGLPTGASPWTVAVWLKTSVALSNGTVQVVATWGAGGGNGKALTFCQSNFSGSGAQYKANAFSLSPQGSFQTGNAAINDGNWHRVAAVYDGTRVSFYVDGVLDRSDSSGNTALNVLLGATLYFGFDGGSPKWNGSIGDMVVWARALSAPEIASDYSDPWQQLRGTGALTAGSVSANGTPGVTTIPLVASPSTGGTAPYSYQWQWSAYGANSWADVAGETSLTLAATGLASGTPYDYRLKTTDSAGSPATVYTAAYSAQTLFPVDHANVHLSPTNWYVAGSNPATNAVTVRGGSCLSFGFTGTSARLVLDMTNVAAPGNIVCAWSVDYGARTTGSPAATVTLASGLSAGTHAALFWDAAQGSAANCWNVNGTYPDYCVNVKGIQLDVGATLAAGPSWPADKTLLVGDSITAGATSGPSGSGDAGYSLGMVVAQALDSEPCFDAFSSSGFTVTAGASNVPPYASRIGYHFAGRARSLSGLRRVCLYLGYNDGNGSYGATVASCLAALRAAVGPAVPVYVFVYLQGTARAPLTAGFTSYAGALTATTLAGTATYSKGPNDAKAYLIDFGADWAPGFGVGAGGIWSSDAAHYNTLGAVRAGSLFAWAIRSIEGAGTVGGTSRGRLQGV